MIKHIAIALVMASAIISTPSDADETVVASAESLDDYAVPGVIIEGYPAEGVVIPFREDSGYDESQPHLTKQSGVFYGESGKETYYNLPMGRVVNYMRELGYTVEEYPYWVRSDGAKMLGNYVMLAANTDAYPKGTILKTSLGYGIVCDDCPAARSGRVSLDIATSW